MNTQAPESKSHHLETLDIQDIFLTIQGEGPYTGCPAVFVRLAGCNLQCPGCDTDYTSKRRRISVYEVCDTVLRTSDAAILVVITGGEPFRQNIKGLCEKLLSLSYRVQVESNGTLPISPGLPDDVYIVCSPKTGSIHSSFIGWPNLTYKYVLKAGQVAEDDGLPTHALNHPAKPRLARPHEGYRGDVYVQPMDEKDAVLNSANLEAAKASVMAFNYRLQLQTHKIIGVD